MIFQNFEFWNTNSKIVQEKALRSIKEAVNKPWRSLFHAGSINFPLHLAEAPHLRASLHLEVSRTGLQQKAWSQKSAPILEIKTQFSKISKGSHHKSLSEKFFIKKTSLGSRSARTSHVLILTTVFLCKTWPPPRSPRDSAEVSFSLSHSTGHFVTPCSTCFCLARGFCV